MSYIILLLCIAIIVIHFSYYIFVFNYFNLSKDKNTKNKPPVSVLVCAKNEAENLQKLLPILVKQQYDHFEIVLINDRSYDETENIYEEYALKYSFVKIVNVKDVEHFHGNKKYALTLGIKAAKHDCLLFTDADCIPKSDFWIEEMASQFNETTQVVLGYGPHQKIKFSFLNKIIRYETLITALQYFSFAKIGTPYMGVGRNLMYSKQLFLKNKGYNKHINVMSGDDDLLINQIANSKNTKICYTENSHMTSAPKSTLKSLITQKRRHISTANLYKVKHKILLGLYALNRSLFWIVFPIALLQVKTTDTLILISILIALKIVSEYIVVGIAASKLKEKDMIVLIPFLDLFLLIFQLYVFICNLIAKPKHWS